MIWKINKQARPKGKHRDAFTLVELLVVIGILSILMSLLLPALFAAREMANRAVCMNQQRMLVYSVTAYANDHNEFFPLGTAGTGSTLNEDHARWLRGGSYRALVEDSDYITAPALLVCPNLDICNPPWHQPSTDSYRLGYQYLVNREKLNQAYGYGLARRISSIGSASLPVTADINEFVLGSHTFYSHTGRGGLEGMPADGGYDPQVYGAEGGNQSRVDGSVHWYRFPEMTLNKVKSGNAMHLAYFTLPD